MRQNPWRVVSREMTNTLIAHQALVRGLDFDVMAPMVTGNRIFSQQRFRCYASVSMRGHYRFTWNQIPPQKQLTDEIEVYTRVPIQSIPSRVCVGYSGFPVKDSQRNWSRFFLVKNVTWSLTMILEGYLVCKA